MSNTHVKWPSAHTDNLDNLEACLEWCPISTESTAAWKEAVPPVSWLCSAYAFQWLHEAKQMLGKLLLAKHREFEDVMINMTNAWLKAMKYVKTNDVMYSLSHWRRLLQQTNNITTIYRVDQREWDHTYDVFNAPVREFVSKAIERQIKVDVIPAEPEATAQPASSQDSVLFKPHWTYPD